MEIIKINFGLMLYTKRMEYCFSQEQMAEWLCISTRQYIDLENVKRKPSLETFLNAMIKLEQDAGEFIQLLVSQGYTVEDKANTLKESVS